MAWLTDILNAQFANGALVLVRILALVAVAPVLGPFELAMRWRMALAFVLTVFVTPLGLGHLAETPESIGRFLTLAGGEALIGLMLGLGVRILFSCLQVAGQAISQMSGLQLAEVFNPGLGASVPVFSQLLLLVATAVFLALGGHRMMVEALLDSFTNVPAGEAAFGQSSVQAVTTLVAQSFLLGIRIAAPAVVALLLATLIIGFLSRTLPQLNLLALGFGVNAIVALVAVAASLGSACWILQDSLQPTLQTILNSFRTG